MSTFTFTVIAVLAAVYGLCIGSFLNVVICRLPAGRNMTSERSACPKCGSMIHWYDNIPLLSFLLLRGKCRKCGLPISFRYPLNEALNMLLWLCGVLWYRDNLPYAAVCAVAASLSICVFWIDVDTHLIYDRFPILLALCGVAAIFFDRETHWSAHLIGAVAGAGAFLLVGTLVSKKVGAEALGMGDVKLIAAIGLILGWGKLIFCILVSSLLAFAVMKLTAIRKNYDNKHEYAFGPFLVTGLMIAMFFGNTVIGWYLRLLGV